MNKLRTLLWINMIRLRQGRLPRLRWPKNRLPEAYERRSLMCPVAQMILRNRAGGWVTDKWIQLDGSEKEIDPPEYVTKVIREFDHELSKS